MANRRMISKDIFFSDRFTDLSVTARMLYVYMILNADDEGMLSNLKQAIFMAGGNKEDIQELIDNGYVKKFESGVYAIIHWYLMNRVQPTRRKNTIFSAELEELGKDEVYESCRQYVDKVPTQYSVDKVPTQYSVDKVPTQYSQNQESQNQENQNQGNQNKVSENQRDEIDGKFEEEISSYLENPEYLKVKQYFTEKIGAIRLPNEYMILNDLLEMYGYDYLICCIDIAKNHNGKTVQYLAKVCETKNVSDSE